MPIITGDGIRMKSWHILLVAAAVVLILVRAIATSLKRNKERKHRDFSRKLETLLKEKESVKVICPQKDGSAILTNNRLIIKSLNPVLFAKMVREYGRSFKNAK